MAMSHDSIKPRQELRNSTNFVKFGIPAFNILYKATLAFVTLFDTPQAEYYKVGASPLGMTRSILPPSS
jgi:hypothetical protein